MPAMADKELSDMPCPGKFKNSIHRIVAFQNFSVCPCGAGNRETVLESSAVRR